MLEKTLESPVDSTINPINPKGNQPWIFIGRTHAEAEVLVLCPTDAKNWLAGNDSDVGKDWGQEEKGVTEVEMVKWHHWLNGHESEQAPGDSEDQGSLECYSPWGRKEWDTTEWLNNNNICASYWNKIVNGILCNVQNHFKNGKNINVQYLLCLHNIYVKVFLVQWKISTNSWWGFPVREAEKELDLG